AGVILMRWIPAMLVRRQDRAAGRRVYLKVYDDVRDPAASAAQELDVTGRRVADFSLSLDIEGTFVSSDRFRFVREVSDRRPRGLLTYRWRDSKKLYPTRLSVGAPKTLDGLPAGNYLVQLFEESNR